MYLVLVFMGGGIFRTREAHVISCADRVRYEYLEKVLKFDRNVEYDHLNQIH